MVCSRYFWGGGGNKTRCLEENEEKHGRKENSERKRKKENKREAHRASLNYAEELGPLLFLGRRSKGGAGWLSDAFFMFPLTHATITIFQTSIPVRHHSFSISLHAQIRPKSINQASLGFQTDRRTPGTRAQLKYS